MKDIKTAEEWLTEKYGIDYKKTISFEDEIEIMLDDYSQYLLKAKVESISDEEIKKMFTTEHFSQSNGRYYRTRVERITGARMFKNKLLNDL